MEWRKLRHWMGEPFGVPFECVNEYVCKGRGN